MDSLEARWREHLARQECTDLVYKLARAIDRCDEELLKSLFHDDATDDHGMFHGTARDFVPWVMGVLATMHRTQHCICNTLIEVKGDAAYGESYFVAHHTIPGEDGRDRFMVAGGRYLDRFERRIGTWKIARRQAVYDWSSTEPSSDNWNRAAPGQWAFGQRGQDDRSYAHFRGGL